MIETPAAKRRPRMWLLLLVVAVIAAGATTGVIFATSRTGSPTAEPQPTGTPSAAATSTGGMPDTRDLNARHACEWNVKAQTDDKLSDRETLRQIVFAASQSSDSAVTVAANLLWDSFEMAEAARGASDEVARTLDVTTQSIRMQTVCVRAGYL
ncbi:hypothetical protein HDA40_006109 [Hamadaea flava]|uniref:Uncharacterized protein n=1 Tax=Hamadaea flava TaxID=1742688 RepID=A0ABV8LVU4_9ACTN|nr:hypothetical protein [Hamadaea flava]MCP2327602.1 hypothetical protein [Hamadaea flava]